MKGLETAIVRALREAGSADAQSRARIYQSARDALTRAIAKQQLEGTEAAVSQKRKLEKLINTIEAQYQRAQERRREAVRSAPSPEVVPEPRPSVEPAPEAGANLDMRDEYQRPEPVLPPEGGSGRSAPPLRAGQRAASRDAGSPDWHEDIAETGPELSERGPARRQAHRSADRELEDFLFENEDAAPEPVEDEWPFDDTDGRVDQVQPVEASKTTPPTPDARREPVEDEWPFGDSEEWIDDGPRVDRPKTMRRASENPRDFIEDDWPVDEADDRIGDRPASPRRAPDAPPVSHSGERRHSPAAPASQRRPAPGLYPEGPDREPQGRYREPEPKRRRKPRPQQRSRREEPGFGDPPRRPAAEPERTTRPDRWSEPEADRRPGRPPAPASGRKRRFPVYSLILILALCIACVGIGIWWFVIGGLGLSEAERDTSVPNPPASVEMENFAGSPRPQGRFGEEWITVFTPDDITDVTESSDASVELVDNGGRQALKIVSRNPDEEGEATFKIGAGVLQSMANRESLIALTLRSSSEEPTQIYVRCNLPGLGDCGRRRFDVSYEVQDVIFSVDLSGKTFNGGEGQLLINSDVSGDERGIDLFSIRIRPE